MTAPWISTAERKSSFPPSLVFTSSHASSHFANTSRFSMAKYKEVPDWWFLLILVGAVAVSIAFLEIYPIDVPVWLVFVLLGINAVFAVPLSFLSATTGTNLGLGSLVQIITGYALPNNPNAFLFGQTLGSWALAGYSDNYVQDQKLAHYCKIAPRAVFRSQIGTIIITCFVAVATQNLILDSIPDVSAFIVPSVAVFILTPPPALRP